MAKNTQSRGACAYCGRDLTRTGMGRHLATCAGRMETVAAADEGSGRETRLFHVQVQDAWDGTYWLNLEVDGSASLRHLDSYLRAIWLECCGHLSEFSTGGHYGKRIAMTKKIHQVFAPGVEVMHSYDFGTTSLTVLKAMERRGGRRTTAHPIALMARNDAPPVTCQECGSVATHFCEECRIEEDLEGVLCAQHARVHPHEEYGEPIPIVNSPRMGMCGYSGPADPPY